MSNLLAESRRLLAAGLSVIPIRPDGTKAPLIAWKAYQARCHTDDELTRWFRSGPIGVAVIAGRVSGNLEVLDFDASTIFTPWTIMVEELCHGLLARLPSVQTPADGRHVYYRCSLMAANQKLAQQLDADGHPEVLIETRGEGGYAIIPPSPAACHPLHKAYTLLHGDLAAIPIITPEERTILLNTARTFNAYVKPARVVAGGSPPRTYQATAERPGDVFNRQAHWPDILEPHGWTRVGQHGDVTFWKRPDKGERGISATTNYAGSRLLYVFSTNAWPFEPETAYSKFAAYALLEHAGDFTAAAKALNPLGYGHRQSLSGASGEWPSQGIVRPGRLRVRQVRSSTQPAIRTIPATEVPAWHR